MSDKDIFHNHRQRGQTIPANFIEQNEAKRTHLEMRIVALTEQRNFLRDDRWKRIQQRMMKDLEAALNRLTEDLPEVKTARLRGQIESLRNIVGLESVLDKEIEIYEKELSRCISSLDSIRS